jgi:hypothetical protein
MDALAKASTKAKKKTVLESSDDDVEESFNLSSDEDSDLD